jgi:hypothetical protein
MADIINLREATKPEFTEVQRNFAGDLIGLGLTRLTIIGLVSGTDVKKLNHAEINSGQRLINELREELGYGIMDARRAQSAPMQALVKSAASRHKLRLKFA